MAINVTGVQLFEDLLPLYCGTQPCHYETFNHSLSHARKAQYLRLDTCLFWTIVRCSFDTHLVVFPPSFISAMLINHAPSVPPPPPALTLTTEIALVTLAMALALVRKPRQPKSKSRSHFVNNPVEERKAFFFQATSPMGAKRNKLCLDPVVGLCLTRPAWGTSRGRKQANRGKKK